MDKHQGWVASWVLTLLVWLVFTWPLPRHLFTGIPSSATNVEQGGPRAMIQGDHLQVLYTFWLTADMLSGKTPIGYDLYQFNAGDDEQRRTMGIDELPFSLVFTLAYWIGLGNGAFAWNAMVFVALWLSFLFTWRLVRRYVQSPWQATLIALLAVAFPYRWSALAGGSPLGYAMTWVPMLMYGVDGIVRGRSFRRGLAAGLAVLFAYWNDAHAIFFSLLLLPPWALVVLTHDKEMEWNNWRYWVRMVRAALPLVAAVAAVAWFGYRHQHELHATTIIRPQRDLREVLLFSPRPAGLWTWRGTGQEGAVYLGFLLPVTLGIGLLAGLYLLTRNVRRQWREFLSLILLAIGITGIVLLALGPRGPAQGRLFEIVRRWIPPYAMIRQPAKIFCLLPPLAAVAVALSLDNLRQLYRLGMIRVLFPTVLPLLVLLEYAPQVRMSVCLLDRDQPAYKAVADDAWARGEAPRALIVPLWPGDSSWASLYQHYVSLYRIRMVNGYQPAVPQLYLDDVYRRWGSVNIGLLSEAQLDELLRRRIHYILLHEDAFPEKVSYFPVAFTLRRLLHHPRLELLQQGMNVWAFRILRQPRERPPVVAEWNRFFPVMQYELEWSPDARGHTAESPSSSGSRYVRLPPESPGVSIPWFDHLEAPEASLWVRARGEARLRVSGRRDNGVETEVRIEIQERSWHWIAIPCDRLEGSERMEVVFRAEEGTVDLDLATYVSGPPLRLAPGETLTLPAPLFFHAGHTDLEAMSVRLRKRYEPADAIFYGPRMPFLDRGEYRIALEIESPAREGTFLGSYRLDLHGERTPELPVIAGRPTQAVDLAYEDRNLPWTLEYKYSRAADVDVRRVVITRLR